jgi:drug/metabolite transporter (DMT)-like permease
MPLWVTPLAIFWLGEKLSAGKWAGLALGLGGVAVLFNPTAFDFQDSRALLGNGLLLLSAVVGSVVIVHMRHHRGALSQLQLMPWQMLLGGVLLAVIASIVEAERQVVWSGPLVLVLAYNGPVASAFCFWAYITVMRSLPAISTSVGSLGVPVSGVIFSALLLDEPLSASRLSGLALILAGVAAVSFSDLRKK